MELLPMLLYVLGLCVLWVLVTLGIWHIVWSSALRREAAKPGAGPTTNGRSAFRMEVQGCSGALLSQTVTGSVNGILPVRGNTILLLRNGKTTPLYITGVLMLDMPEAEAGVRVALKLFGARRLQLTAGDVLTNVRVNRGAAPAAATELRYPVEVRRSRRDYCNSLIPLLLGLAGFLFFLLLFRSTGGTSDNCIIFIALFAAVFLLGLWLLADCLFFRLTLTEDGQVIIRGPGKSTHINIMNLSARVQLNQNGAERWTMEIVNAGGQRLAVIDDRCARFAEARRVFTDAQQRRGVERIYRYLAESEFYVPVAVMQDAATGTAITMPAILTHKETGAPGIFLYDDEALLNGRTPTVRRETMKVSLAHMVELMGSFSAGGEIVVFLSKPNLPKSFAVNRDNWPQLQAFLK